MTKKEFALAWVIIGGIFFVTTYGVLTILLR